jgi:diguanylate cyclase (GGDEF)-like protein/PAS domain S-box-containing protein
MAANQEEQRSKKEEELLLANQRLTSILGSIDDLILVLDENGYYVEYYQPADKPELYAPPERFLGKHVMDTEMPEQTARAHLDAINQYKRRGKPFEYDYQIPIGGQIRWFSAKISGLKDLQGRRSGFIVATRDITERKNWEKQLEELSITDPLTKAYNRLRFMAALEAEIRRSKRYVSSFSLVMLDIDHFKSINDDYGHDIGDEILIAVTELIQGEIRITDLLSRWGGEEFILLMTHTDGSTAAEAAERIRRSLEAFRFEHVGEVTASFGVTEYRPPEGADAVLKRVDEALYGAKRQGRNRVLYD